MEFKKGWIKQTTSTRPDQVFRELPRSTLLVPNDIACRAIAEDEKVDESRRGFLTKGAALGLAAGLGMKVEPAEAGTYEMPGAVRAEPNAYLRNKWKTWHDTNLIWEAKAEAKAKMAFNHSGKIFNKSVYETSHIYYILEAKMGLSSQSLPIANNILNIKNNGLARFRTGCSQFFENKNYHHARTEFANGLFFSANLSVEECKELGGAYFGNSDILDSMNYTQFMWALGTKFEQASVNAKENMLQDLVKTGLKSQEELNLFWNLGFYILSEIKLGLGDPLKSRNDKDKTYRNYFRRRYDYNTANSLLI